MHEDESSHSHYDTIDISEFTMNEDGLRIQYPCPCGDLFEVSLKQLEEGHRVAQCPTCSLTIYIQYASLQKALEKIPALTHTA